MTTPPRWADSGSGSDPVLRSVLRYARGLSPDPSRVHALLEHAEAASAPRTPRPSPLRRALANPWSKAALLVASSAAAWAGVHALQSEPSGLTPSAELPSLPSLPSPAPRTPPAGVAPTAAQHATAPRRATPPTANVPAAPAPPVNASPPPSPASPLALPSSAGPPPPQGDEVTLLARARGQVRKQPSAALDSIRQHAAAYPNSTLREEREALQIETLIALGRRTEARALLSSFETSYPRSVYRRRLKSLMP